jgi:hypothetical protein
VVEKIAMPIFKLNKMLVPDAVIELKAPPTAVLSNAVARGINVAPPVFPLDPRVSAFVVEAQKALDRKIAKAQRKAERKADRKAEKERCVL